MSEDKAIFKVGDLVDVMARGWIGINKQGGAGTVLKVRFDEDGDIIYDVKYVVEGCSEAGIYEKFIKPRILEETRRSRQSVKGRCAIPFCPCFIRDCGHIQPGAERTIDNGEKLEDGTIQESRPSTYIGEILERKNNRRKKLLLRNAEETRSLKLSGESSDMGNDNMDADDDLSDLASVDHQSSADANDNSGDEDSVVDFSGNSSKSSLVRNANSVVLPRIEILNNKILDTVNSQSSIPASVREIHDLIVRSAIEQSRYYDDVKDDQFIQREGAGAAYHLPSGQENISGLKRIKFLSAEQCIDMLTLAADTIRAASEEFKAIRVAGRELLGQLQTAKKKSSKSLILSSSIADLVSRFDAIEFRIQWGGFDVSNEVYKRLKALRRLHGKASGPNNKLQIMRKGLRMSDNFVGELKITYENSLSPTKSLIKELQSRYYALVGSGNDFGLDTIDEDDSESEDSNKLEFASDREEGDLYDDDDDTELTSVKIDEEFSRPSRVRDAEQEAGSKRKRGHVLIIDKMKRQSQNKDLDLRSSSAIIDFSKANKTNIPRISEDWKWRKRIASKASTDNSEKMDRYSSSTSALQERNTYGNKPASNSQKFSSYSSSSSALNKHKIVDSWSQLTVIVSNSHMSADPTPWVPQLKWCVENRIGEGIAVASGSRYPDDPRITANRSNQSINISHRAFQGPDPSMSVETEKISSIDIENGEILPAKVLGIDESRGLTYPILVGGHSTLFQCLESFTGKLQSGLISNILFRPDSTFSQAILSQSSNTDRPASTPLSTNSSSGYSDGIDGSWITQNYLLEIFADCADQARDVTISSLLDELYFEFSRHMKQELRLVHSWKVSDTINGDKRDDFSSTCKVIEAILQFPRHAADLLSLPRCRAIAFLHVLNLLVKMEKHLLFVPIDDSFLIMGTLKDILGKFMNSVEPMNQVPQVHLSLIYCYRKCRFLCDAINNFHFEGQLLNSKIRDLETLGLHSSEVQVWKERKKELDIMDSAARCALEALWDEILQAELTISSILRIALGVLGGISGIDEFLTTSCSSDHSQKSKGCSYPLMLDDFKVIYAGNVHPVVATKEGTDSTSYPEIAVKLVAVHLLLTALSTELPKVSNSVKDILSSLNFSLIEFHNRPWENINRRLHYVLDQADSTVSGKRLSDSVISELLQLAQEKLILDCGFADIGSITGSRLLPREIRGTFWVRSSSMEDKQIGKEHDDIFIDDQSFENVWLLFALHSYSIAASRKCLPHVVDVTRSCDNMPISPVPNNWKFIEQFLISSMSLPKGTLRTSIELRLRATTQSLFIFAVLARVWDAPDLACSCYLSVSSKIITLYSSLEETGREYLASQFGSDESEQQILGNQSESCASLYNEFVFRQMQSLFPCVRSFDTDLMAPKLLTSSISMRRASTLIKLPVTFAAACLSISTFQSKVTAEMLMFACNEDHLLPTEVISSLIDLKTIVYYASSLFSTLLSSSDRLGVLSSHARTRNVCKSKSEGPERLFTENKFSLLGGVFMAFFSSVAASYFGTELYDPNPVISRGVIDQSGVIEGSQARNCFESNSLLQCILKATTDGSVVLKGPSNNIDLARGGKIDEIESLLIWMIATVSMTRSLSPVEKLPALNNFVSGLHLATLLQCIASENSRNREVISRATKLVGDHKLFNTFTGSLLMSTLSLELTILSFFEQTLGKTSLAADVLPADRISLMDSRRAVLFSLITTCLLCLNKLFVVGRRFAIVANGLLSMRIFTEVLRSHCVSLLSQFVDYSSSCFQSNKECEFANNLEREVFGVILPSCGVLLNQPSSPYAYLLHSVFPALKELLRYILGAGKEISLNYRFPNESQFYSPFELTSFSQLKRIARKAVTIHVAKSMREEFKAGISIVDIHYGQVVIAEIMANIVLGACAHCIRAAVPNYLATNPMQGMFGKEIISSLPKLACKDIMALFDSLAASQALADSPSVFWTMCVFWSRIVIQAAKFVRKASSSDVQREDAEILIGKLLLIDIVLPNWSYLQLIWLSCVLSCGIQTNICEAIGFPDLHNSLLTISTGFAVPSIVTLVTPSLFSVYAPLLNSFLVMNENVENFSKSSFSSNWVKNSLIPAYFSSQPSSLIQLTATLTRIVPSSFILTENQVSLSLNVSLATGLGRGPSHGAGVQSTSNTAVQAASSIADIALRHMRYLSVMLFKLPAQASSFIFLESKHELRAHLLAACFNPLSSFSIEDTKQAVKRILVESIPLTEIDKVERCIAKSLIRDSMTATNDSVSAADQQDTSLLLSFLPVYIRASTCRGIAFGTRDDEWKRLIRILVSSWTNFASHPSINFDAADAYTGLDGFAGQALIGWSLALAMPATMPHSVAGELQKRFQKPSHSTKCLSIMFSMLRTGAAALSESRSKFYSHSVPSLSGIFATQLDSQALAMLAAQLESVNSQSILDAESRLQEFRNFVLIFDAAWTNSIGPSRTIGPSGASKQIISVRIALGIYCAVIQRELRKVQVQMKKQHRPSDSVDQRCEYFLKHEFSSGFQQEMLLSLSVVVICFQILRVISGEPAAGVELFAGEGYGHLSSHREAQFVRHKLTLLLALTQTSFFGNYSERNEQLLNEQMEFEMVAPSLLPPEWCLEPPWIQGPANHLLSHRYSVVSLIQGTCGLVSENAPAGQSLASANHLAQKLTDIARIGGDCLELPPCTCVYLPENAYSNTVTHLRCNRCLLCSGSSILNECRVQSSHLQSRLASLAPHTLAAIIDTRQGEFTQAGQTLNPRPIYSIRNLARSLAHLVSTATGT